LPWAPDDLVAQVQKNILQPMIDEMAKRGTPFVGLLFAGLAITSSGVKVIEFNARFGDPETQVVLARLNSPLSEVLFAAATGKLDKQEKLQWKTQSAVTVVQAAEGYPESPILGAAISGIVEAEQQGVQVYHAGTTMDHFGNYLVNGGRVLSVTALGSDLGDARRRAYQGVERISFTGEQHRTDIALAAAQGEIKVP
jgi:phosphoribosylamine--glycine ligase